MDWVTFTPSMLGRAISLVRMDSRPYFSTKRWLVTPTSVDHLRIIRRRNVISPSTNNSPAAPVYGSG